MSSATGGPCALVQFGEIETHGDAQVDDYIELPPIDSSDEEDVGKTNLGVPEMRERARGGREIIIGRQKEKVDHTRWTPPPFLCFSVANTRRCCAREGALRSRPRHHERHFREWEEDRRKGGR